MKYKNPKISIIQIILQFYNFTILSSWVHLLPMVILVFPAGEDVLASGFTPSQGLLLEQQHVFTGSAPRLVQSLDESQEMTRMTGRRLGCGEVSYTLQHLFTETGGLDEQR